MLRNSAKTSFTSAMLFLAKLLLFQTAIAISSNTPCTNCDGNNVTCVDGVCLPRCVSVTSSGECLQCLDSRFYGEQCEHDCPDTCLNSRCQMNNIRVVCTKGCVAGKKGDNCGVNCDTACTQCERYGDECVGPCQNPLFHGPLCRTKCPRKCTDGCDKETGECGKCSSDHIGSEEMCLRCGPQFLYCDGHCFHCIGDNCQNTSCGTRSAYYTLQVVSSVLGVVVLIGSVCVAVNLARRKTKCRKRNVTPFTVEERDGANRSGLDDWAQNYWEIHDKDTDINSYVSILSLDEQNMTNVNESHVVRKEKSIDQRQPLSAPLTIDEHQAPSTPLTLQSETSSSWTKESADPCLKHDELDINPEASLTEDDEPDIAFDGGGVHHTDGRGVHHTDDRGVHHPCLWKSSSLSNFAESRKKLVHDRCNISLSSLCPTTQRLIRKTNSIVSIERNCDLSHVYVRYLTPGNVDIQSEYMDK